MFCESTPPIYLSLKPQKWSIDFPGSSAGKESACNVGDQGLIPGSERSPGEGNGYPLQYSCLKNAMDRGAWRATVYRITKNWTQLSNKHFLHFQKKDALKSGNKTHFFHGTHFSLDQFHSFNKYSQSTYYDTCLATAVNQRAKHVCRYFNKSSHLIRCHEEHMALPPNYHH